MNIGPYIKKSLLVVRCHFRSLMWRVSLARHTPVSKDQIAAHYILCIIYTVMRTRITSASHGVGIVCVCVLVSYDLALTDCRIFNVRDLMESSHDQSNRTQNR